jgi:hypothetical protein
MTPEERRELIRKNRDEIESRMQELWDFLAAPSSPEEELMNININPDAKNAVEAPPLSPVRLPFRLWSARKIYKPLVEKCLESVLNMDLLPPIDNALEQYKKLREIDPKNEKLLARESKLQEQRKTLELIQEELKNKFNRDKETFRDIVQQQENLYAFHQNVREILYHSILRTHNNDMTVRLTPQGAYQEARQRADDKYFLFDGPHDTYLAWSNKHFPLQKDVLRHKWRRDVVNDPGSLTSTIKRIYERNEESPYYPSLGPPNFPRTLKPILNREIKAEILASNSPLNGIIPNIYREIERKRYPIIPMDTTQKKNSLNT